MAPEVVLISHPSQIWPGARHLHVSDSGRLLCITRNPARDGATRLIEEGFGPATMIIRDANDQNPDIRSTIEA